MRKSMQYTIVGIFCFANGIITTSWIFLEWARLKSLVLSFEDYGQFIYARVDPYLSIMPFLAIMLFTISIVLGIWSFYEANRSEGGEKA